MPFLCTRLVGTKNSDVLQKQMLKGWSFVETEINVVTTKQAVLSAIQKQRITAKVAAWFCQVMGYILKWK